MLTEDYLMRMINQAVAVLLKLAGLKKDGKYPEAQQAIDQALELLFNMRADIIKRLDDESLLQALTVQDRLDVARLGIVADLFKEEGDILAAQGQLPESRKSYLRALTCHLETGFHEPSVPSGELAKKIEPLVQALGLQDLPDGTLWTLFCYYEQTGAVAQARDAITRMANRPHLAESIRPEVEAFEERMLNMRSGGAG